MAAALALLTLFGTWMWLPWFLVVTKLIGFGHPPVSVPEEGLSPGRWVVCALCLVALAGCMMPVPFRVEPL